MGEDQEYKLGIWVRDNTQGIGTLTYVEEDGSYGALGHGISDTDTGELLDIAGGELYQAQIVSVLKGTKGNPGELSGYIDYDDSKRIGTIDRQHDKVYSVLWAMAACIASAYFHGGGLQTGGGDRGSPDTGRTGR